MAHPVAHAPLHRAEAQFERQPGSDDDRTRAFAARVAEHCRRSETLVYAQAAVRHA